MTFLALATSALVLMPYKPEYDCTKDKEFRRTPVYVELQVRSNGKIFWNGQETTKELFDSYLAQAQVIDQARKGEFIVVQLRRDASSFTQARSIVSELKAAKLPFAKHVCGIP